jgi:hypothetical protein
MPPHRLRRALTIGAAGAAAVAATHLVDFGAGRSGTIFDASYEWSWSHYAATAAFGAGALAGAAGRAWAGERPREWAVAAVLFGAFCADGATRWHDSVPHWPLLYAPLLLALAAALWRLSAGREEAAVVRAGLGLLAVALAIHVLGPAAVRALGWSADGWAYQVKVALKEGSELAGWLVVVPALARLARRQPLAQAA